jgi:small subunit ribosomal protein S20
VANHKQSKKRSRQTIVRNVRNRAIRSRVRSCIKAVHAAVESGNAAEASGAMPLAVRAIDRAVTKGVFHRKTASRTISRLHHAVAKLNQG